MLMLAVLMLALLSTDGGSFGSVCGDGGSCVSCAASGESDS